MTRFNRFVVIAAVLVVNALFVAPFTPAQAETAVVVMKTYSSVRSSAAIDDEGAIPRRPGKKPDKAVSVVTGSSVDIGNGTYTFSETDLRVPARSIPVEMSRTYRSNQIMKGADESNWHFATPLDGPMGYGWYSPWFVRLGTDGSFVDGEGNFTIFTQDANGAFLPDSATGRTLIKITGGYEIRKKGDTTQVFDSNGRLQQIKDNLGNVVRLNYNPDGKLYTVTDAAGRPVLTFSYWGNYLFSVTDIANRTVRYNHDFSGNLLDVTIALGAEEPVRIASYAYDMTTYPKAPVLCSRDEWDDESGHHVVTKCYTDQTVNTYHNLTQKSNAVGESYVIAYEPMWRNKGIVKSITDPNGRTMFFNYDFPGGNFTYTDYDGRRYRKILNDKGQLVYLSEILSTPTGDKEQLVKKIEYLDGRVEVSTDAAGVKTTEQKDEWGNVIRKVDGEGNEWRYTYTPDGKLMSSNDPLGTITRYEYNAAGSRTKETLAAGTPDESVTTYLYDKYNQLTSVIKGGGATTYSYDTGGNVTGIKDPVGNSTTMIYDGAGNLMSRTVPLIGATTYENFGYKGNPGKVTDPNGNVITYTYDLLGRVMTITNGADGGVTTYTYVTTGNGSCTSCGGSSGGAGKIASIVFPEGNKKSYSYDYAGNIIKVVDSVGNYISYLYDTQGNNIAEWMYDADGNIQRKLEYQYDLCNRLIKTTNAYGSASENSYDKNGNRIKTKDMNGNITFYIYDKLNRLINVSQPGNTNTIYSYDRRNNLNSITDANGNITLYEYDYLDQLSKITAPDTGTTFYTYFQNGKTESKTDAKGVVINYHYDVASRLIQIAFPDSAENVNYVYDSCFNGKGKVCSMKDPSGTTSYEYTKNGRVKKETSAIDDQVLVTEYTYDRNGNNITEKYPSGRIVQYSYVDDRVSGVSSDGTQLASGIIYKPFGGLATMKFGNGIIVTNTFDQQYRVVSVSADSIQDLKYSYDKNGNITTITDSLDLNKTKEYNYDSLDRLIHATGPWGNLYYTYDNVGNRKSESHNELITNYLYNTGSNQLINVTGDNNYMFEVDYNGNTSRNNKYVYVYSQNQRLIKVVEQFTKLSEQGEEALMTVVDAEYVHNGNGQRVKKTVKGHTTYYAFDQEGNLIGEFGAGSSDYVYLGKIPLAKFDGEGVHYIHSDHVGTPIKMTDTDKQPVWEINAMPFGETATITGAGTNNLRFPGQYYDEETGLNYNYYRSYLPATGRYLQSDPVWDVFNLKEDARLRRIGMVKRLLDFNLYTYARNNVVNATDRLGLYTGNSLCYTCDKPGLAKCLLKNHGAVFKGSRNIASCLETVFLSGGKVWPQSCADALENVGDVYECFEDNCNTYNVKWDDANKGTPYSTDACKCALGKTVVNGVIDITKECCK